MKTILFDLDGTLLPMDQNKFTTAYMELIQTVFTKYGYGNELVNVVWKGVAAMVKNDGSVTNEEAFWKTFAEFYGEKALADKKLFDEFYRKEFNDLRSVCGYDENAAATVATLKEKGFEIVLASNPIFPADAQKNRMRWAGLNPDDFCLVTSYENSRYCKPNCNYYAEITEKLKEKPLCMVGNDVVEDTPAKQVGIEVFLLTDCIINKRNEDLSSYRHGNFTDLLRYITEEF